MLSRSHAHREASRMLGNIGVPSVSAKPQYLQEAPREYDANGKAIPTLPAGHEQMLGADPSGKVMTAGHLLKVSKHLRYVPPTHKLGSGNSSASAPRQASLGGATSSATPQLTSGAAAGDANEGGADGSRSLWDILDGTADDTATTASAPTPPPQAASTSAPILPKVQRGKVVIDPNSVVGAEEDDMLSLMMGTYDPYTGAGEMMGGRGGGEAANPEGAPPALTARTSSMVLPRSKKNASAMTVGTTPSAAAPRHEAIRRLDGGGNTAQTIDPRISVTSPSSPYTSNSQFVQQLLSGFGKANDAAIASHTAAKQSWATERKELKQHIRRGSYPLSKSSKDWARALAEERMASGGSAAANQQQQQSGYPLDAEQQHASSYSPIPQLRPVAPNKREVWARTTVAEAPSDIAEPIPEEGDDDDVVVDPYHDEQLGLIAEGGSSTDTTALTTTSTGDMLASPQQHQQKQSASQKHATTTALNPKDEALNRKNKHMYNGIAMNPIRAASKAGSISPDIIDLVTEEFAHVKQQEIEKRQRILYELTHPIPTDYTFNGKLVPPPPISFGKVTEEAMLLGSKMMTQQPYRLVREAKSSDYFFELNDLYMEIVMVGRANAGKSSLINGLLNQPIAKTSSTPNSTRGVNFYQSVTPEEIKKFVGRDPSKLVKLPAGGLQLTFVDLPGFGITGMSEKWRDNAIQATDSYLGVRRSVNTVFMCVDAVKGLTHIDKRYLEWIENLHGTFYIVLTKCDAVSHQRLCDVMRSIYQLITDRQSSTRKKSGHRAVFPYIIPVSAKTGHNMDLLRGLVVETSGMIAGGKLREMLHRKMEQRNMLAERDELKRIAEARAIEKEIAAEEFKAQQLLTDGRRTEATMYDDGTSDSMGASDDAMPTAGMPPTPNPNANTTTSITLNADIAKRIMGRTRGDAKWLEKAVGGGASNTSTTTDGKAATPSYASAYAKRFNLGIKDMPLELKYNSATGEIEEVAVDGAPNPHLGVGASAYMKGFDGDDLDGLAEAAMKDEAAAAGKGTNGGGDDGTKATKGVPLPAGGLGGPQKTSSVIGLGSDGEQFAKMAGGGSNNNSGAVSSFLDSFEAYERQAAAERRAQEESIAAAAYGGVLHPTTTATADGETTTPFTSTFEGRDVATVIADRTAPDWYAQKVLAKDATLKKVRLFVEETDARKAVLARAGGRAHLREHERLSNQWVSAAEQDEDANGNTKKRSRWRSGKDVGMGKRSKLREIVEGKKCGDVHRSYGAGVGGRGISANTKRVEKVVGEMSRRIVRPYDGLRPVDVPAVVGLPSSSSSGSSSSSVKGVVTTDAAAARKVILAQRALKASPDAPWKGLAGDGGLSSIKGIGGAEDAALGAAADAAAAAKMMAALPDGKRPSPLGKVSEATRRTWGDEEALDELATFHALEEANEAADATVFGGLGGMFGQSPSAAAAGGRNPLNSKRDDAAGGITNNYLRNPLAFGKVSSTKDLLHSSNRIVKSNLGDEKRTFGGSAEHRAKVEQLVKDRGQQREGLRGMQQRLAKEHNIHMSGKELDWYNKTAGKTVNDYDLFHGETKLKMHMSDPRIGNTVYSREQMAMGNASRINIRGQSVGMLRKYGRKKSYWKTPGVKGIPEA